MAITGKQANEWVKPIAIGLGIYALWKYGISPTLETLQLKDTKEEQASEKAQQQAEQAPVNKDYWSPNFYKQSYKTWPVPGKAMTLLTLASGQSYAIAIWDAFGVFNDNENNVYAIFRAIKYKSQISFVADLFYKKYQRDLYQFLKDKLSSAELGTVLTITNKKPWGILTNTGIKGLGRII